MRGQRKEPDEPLLFDLPLDVSERQVERPMPRRGKLPPEERIDRMAGGTGGGPTELSFLDDDETFETEPVLPAAPAGKAGRPAGPVPVPASKRSTRPAPVRAVEPEASTEGAETWEEADVTDAASEGRAAVGSRLAAAGADLLIHAAVAIGIVLGTRAMGVKPTLDEWPAVLLFLMAFSFLYAVVPLAFWGHTLGMAWAGTTSRNRDGEPLTFDQTTRRWAGGILTLATLGLPLLFARRGRALSDLLSGSETYSSPQQPQLDEADPA
jgi:uncharacterized RDD family membrane protein YckC